MEQDPAVTQRLLRVITRAAQLHRPEGQEFSRLLDEASALLWLLTPQDPPLPLTTLKRYIVHFPLEYWLDERMRAGFTGSLRLGGAPSVLCDEIQMELDPAKEWERVQSIMVDVRDYCRERENGQQEYEVFRRYVIEHGVVDIDLGVDFLLPLNTGLTALYEAIPLRDQRDGQIYQCPTCGWPMHLDSHQVRCGARWCWEQGGSYSWHKEELVSSRYSTHLEPRPAANLQRLKTGLWKFTLTPGLLELQLFDQLAKLGLKPTLWPEVDRADIQFEHGGKVIEIDAKVWASPSLLGSHLMRLGDRELWVVIPNYQSAYVHSLNESSPARVKVMTQRQCIREASKLCRA